MDRSLSSRLHWANDAVWYVPCFSYSIVRPLSYRFVSGNLSQARSWFFEVKIARSESSDLDAVYLTSNFTDILDAPKQIQIKSLTKADAISFWIAETTLSSFLVDGFIHASVQIKRSTLERWLQHHSISHIDWRQVVGDRTCVYSELPAIKHFLDVTSRCVFHAHNESLASKSVVVSCPQNFSYWWRVQNPQNSGRRR